MIQLDALYARHSPPAPPVHSNVATWQLPQSSSAVKRVPGLIVSPRRFKRSIKPSEWTFGMVHNDRLGETNSISKIGNECDSVTVKLTIDFSLNISWVLSSAIRIAIALCRIHGVAL